jgi:hypothetical protein
MPIDQHLIQPGHCYSAGRVVYKVIDVRGDMVTYVIRDKLEFPTDMKKCRTVTLQTLALEIAQECHVIGSLLDASRQ